MTELGRALIFGSGQFRRKILKWTMWLVGFILLGIFLFNPVTFVTAPVFKSLAVLTWGRLFGLWLFLMGYWVHKGMA